RATMCPPANSTRRWAARWKAFARLTTLTKTSAAAKWPCSGVIRWSEVARLVTGHAGLLQRGRQFGQRARPAQMRDQRAERGQIAARQRRGLRAERVHRAAPQRIGLRWRQIGGAGFGHPA